MYDYLNKRKSHGKRKNTQEYEIHKNLPTVTRKNRKVTKGAPDHDDNGVGSSGEINPVVPLVFCEQKFIKLSEKN